MTKPTVYKNLFCVIEKLLLLTNSYYSFLKSTVGEMISMKEVKFIQMKDGDKEDYDFLINHEVEHTKGTADRLLKALVELDEGLSGYKITRLGHSLQSATRAWRDGADIDWIVSALLHDIGDIYAPYNHDEYAASILKPFVREQCTWVVEKHGIFQMLITVNMSTPILINVKNIEDTYTFKIVQIFANYGIKKVLIPIMTLNQLIFLPQWLKKFLPVNLMTQYLLDKMNENPYK